MSGLQENQIVPLVATLECPEGETVFVRAIVKDKDDNVLDTISLTDKGGGEFFDDSFLMPDKPLVRVRYEVFDDALFTTPSDDFPCPEDEVFTLLDIAQAQAVKVDHLVGIVSVVRLFGKVNNSIESLKGIVNHNELTGIVRPVTRLLGLVGDEQKLTGALKS